MSYILELILSLFSLPSWERRDEKSIVGESRLDQQARLFGRIFYGILAFLIVAALVWFVLLKP